MNSNLPPHSPRQGDRSTFCRQGLLGGFLGGVGIFLRRYPGQTALGLSLLLHLLLGGVVGVGLLQHSLSNQPISPQDAFPPIEVVDVRDLQPQRRAAVGATAQEPGSGPRGGSSSARGAGEGRLGPLAKFGLRVPKKSGEGKRGIEWQSPEKGGGEVRGKGILAGYHFAETTSIQVDSKRYAFFYALLRRIRNRVPYPRELTHRRLSGRVAVAVRVDHRGVFTGQFDEARSGVPLLMAYSGAATVSALSEPLGEPLWLKPAEVPPRGIPLIIRFDYELFFSGTAPENRSFVAKNILEVHVASKAPGIPDEIYARLIQYVPPIIPIPGGAVIDVVGTYYWVKHIMSSEPKKNESDRRRLAVQKEKWKRLLSKDERRGPQVGHGSKVRSEFLLRDLSTR